MQASTSWADVAFSSSERDRHLGIGPVSQLDTWPVVSPVNASRRPSRDAAHHSGSGWLARPSPWGTFTSYSLPAFLAHSESGQEPPFCNAHCGRLMLAQSPPPWATTGSAER